MSQFSKPENPLTMSALASKIGEVVRTNQSQQVLTNDLTESLLTMESAFANPTAPADVKARVAHARNQYSNIHQGYKTILGEDAAKVLGFSPSEVNLEAATIATMALGNVDGYKARLKAMSSGSITLREGDVMASPYLTGSHGQIEYNQDYLDLQSFNNDSLDRFQNINVLSAMASSVQSPFAEALYKTIIKTPEEPAILVEVSRGVVYSAFTYEGDNTKKDFGFKNLLDGISDPSILVTNDTKLVPFKNADTQSVLDDVVEWNEKIGGVNVLTAPYLFDADIGYIDISSNPALLAGGQYNDSDQIDAFIGLDQVFIGLDDGAAVVPLTLKGLPTSRYVPQFENQSREMVLNFVSDSFSITGTGQKDWAGQDLPSGLETAIGTNKVYFKLQINGSVNLNQNGGYLNGRLQVTRIVTALGAELTGAAKQAVIDALGVVTLRSYTWDARRDNGNHRTRGLQVTTHSFREVYRVYTNPPISIIVPTKDATAASAALKELVNAQRTRNDINAVTQALNYIEMIRPHKDHKVGEVPFIQGTGRWYVPVFFDELNFNADEALQSTNSTQKASDVTASLLNYVSDIVFRMYARTRYRAAAQYLNSDNVKEVVQITTGPELARYLTRFGDPRMVGEGIETKIEWTYDERFENMIHITLVRPTAGDIDPLSHGNFLVIPEVSSVIPKNIQGATVDEVKVVSRTLHINNLPAVGVIKVDMQKLRNGLKLVAPIPFNEV